MTHEKTRAVARRPSMRREKIRSSYFLPEGKTVEFEHGKLPYKEHGKEQSILDVALNYGVRLDHACGGNCACTTCHVWVKEGAENLTEWTMTRPTDWTWRPIFS